MKQMNISDEGKSMTIRNEDKANEMLKTFVSQTEGLVNSHQTWRDHTGFALPDTRQCIMYAITELGEFFDATLRSERPNDTRNRDDVESTELSEACDMVAMTVSALCAIGGGEIVINDPVGLLKLNLMHPGTGSPIVDAGVSLMEAYSASINSSRRENMVLFLLIALANLNKLYPQSLQVMTRSFEMKVEARLKRKGLFNG